MVSENCGAEMKTLDPVAHLRDPEAIAKTVKRKLLLDLWDSLPGHEATGDTAGSIRAMLLFSEVGDEIRQTRWK